MPPLPIERGRRFACPLSDTCSWASESLVHDSSDVNQYPGLLVIFHWTFVIFHLKRVQRRHKC